MSDVDVTREGEDVQLVAWVVPGSSRAVIDGRHGDRLKIRVTAPPEDGRANEEAMRLLADQLGTEVILKKGMRGRAKVFQVIAADVATVRRKLGI